MAPVTSTPTPPPSQGPAQEAGESPSVGNDDIVEVVTLRDSDSDTVVVVPTSPRTARGAVARAAAREAQRRIAQLDRRAASTDSTSESEEASTEDAGSVCEE